MRPYVILKIAQSLDGYLDDRSKKRAVFSNQEDLDEVDKLRSECDAILVGAETIRKDDPRLLIRSEELKKQRISQGKERHPIKVTYSLSGQIPHECNFLCLGENKKLVYLPLGVKPQEDIEYIAEVINCELAPKNILEDLSKRGVKKLLIEAGAKTAKLFLESDLVDEIRIAIAPVILGNLGGPGLGDGFIRKLKLERQIVSTKNLSGLQIINIK